VDLVATLLEIAGVQKPNGLRGHPLLPLIYSEQTNDFKHVYAESHSEGNCTGSFMIRRGEWKYIYFSAYSDNLLFDLRKDPEELNNLAGTAESTAIERELDEL
jgi:choline-sulfatase